MLFVAYSNDFFTSISSQSIATESRHWPKSRAAVAGLVGESSLSPKRHDKTLPVAESLPRAKPKRKCLDRRSFDIYRLSPDESCRPGRFKRHLTEMERRQPAISRGVFGDLRGAYGTRCPAAQDKLTFLVDSWRPLLPSFRPSGGRIAGHHGRDIETVGPRIEQKIQSVEEWQRKDRRKARQAGKTRH